MLTFKLNNEPTNIQQTICYVRKSPISQSHKSYKIPLHTILKNIITINKHKQNEKDIFNYYNRFF